MSKLFAWSLYEENFEEFLNRFILNWFSWIETAIFKKTFSKSCWLALYSSSYSFDSEGEEIKRDEADATSMPKIFTIIFHNVSTKCKLSSAILGHYNIQ